MNYSGIGALLVFCRSEGVSAAPETDLAKRRDHLGCEELEMGLCPLRRQSRRQGPGIEVRDRDVVRESLDHLYRRVRVNDLEKSASPQLFAITQMLGKGAKPCRG